MSLRPETRRVLEAYLADRAEKGNFQAALAYDEKTGYVTIHGRSVAGGTERNFDSSTLFEGPQSIRAVRSAIDRVAGQLST